MNLINIFTGEIKDAEDWYEEWCDHESGVDLTFRPRRSWAEAFEEDFEEVIFTDGEWVEIDE